MTDNKTTVYIIRGPILIDLVWAPFVFISVKVDCPVIAAPWQCRALTLDRKYETSGPLIERWSFYRAICSMCRPFTLNTNSQSIVRAFNPAAPVLLLNIHLMLLELRVEDGLPRLVLSDLGS